MSDALAAYARTFRALIARFETLPDPDRLARDYATAGITDPAEAVSWYLLGHGPAAAERLAAAGATPDAAAHAEMAAADAVDGGRRIADLDAD